MAHSETPYLTGSAPGSLSLLKPLARMIRVVFQHPVYSLWLIALAYLVAITLAEALTALFEPRVGLALHGLVLVALLLHASLWARNTFRRFLLSLALAPLIRLLSLSLPLPSFPFVYWYMVVGAPLFLAAFVAARMGRVNVKMMGLTWRGWPLQILVAATGIGLGYLEYVILRPDPLLPELRLGQILAPALILLVFTGFLEELIFRGLMQYTALRIYGRLGLLYIAIIFAVLHIGYRSVIDLVFVFIVAIYFGWITQRSGSILGVTLAHGLTNIGLYLVFPFILAAPVKIPVDVPPPQPGLLAPAATQQSTRLWLPPTHTPIPTSSPTATPSPAMTATPEMTVTPTMTATPTPTPCGAPAGWVQYDVQYGDTLASLSTIYGISKKDMRLANCLTSNQITVGQRLFVPYLPPTQAWPTATPPTVSTKTPVLMPVSPTPIPSSTPNTLPTHAVSPSHTPLPATSTPLLPTAAPHDTDTPFPPTEPPPPSTETPLPPTEPPPPPTETPLPPTEPPPPPTETPLPPTNTPLPPVDTPLPPTPAIAGRLPAASRFQ